MMLTAEQANNIQLYPFSNAAVAIDRYHINLRAQRDMLCEFYQEAAAEFDKMSAELQDRNRTRCNPMTQRPRNESR